MRTALNNVLNNTKLSLKTGIILKNCTVRTLTYIFCVWISAAVAALLYLTFYDTQPTTCILMGIIPVMTGLMLSPILLKKEDIARI